MQSNHKVHFLDAMLKDLQQESQNQRKQSYSIQKNQYIVDSFSKSNQNKSFNQITTTIATHQDTIINQSNRENNDPNSSFASLTLDNKSGSYINNNRNKLKLKELGKKILYFKSDLQNKLQAVDLENTHFKESKISIYNILTREIDKFQKKDEELLKNSIQRIKRLLDYNQNFYLELETLIENNCIVKDEDVENAQNAFDELEKQSVIARNQEVNICSNDFKIVSSKEYIRLINALQELKSTCEREDHQQMFQNEQKISCMLSSQLEENKVFISDLKQKIKSQKLNKQIDLGLEDEKEQQKEKLSQQIKKQEEYNRELGDKLTQINNQNEEIKQLNANLQTQKLQQSQLEQNFNKEIDKIKSDWLELIRIQQTRFGMKYKEEFSLQYNKEFLIDETNRVFDELKKEKEINAKQIKENQLEIQTLTKQKDHLEKKLNDRLDSRRENELFHSQEIQQLYNSHNDELAQANKQIKIHKEELLKLKQESQQRSLIQKNESTQQIQQLQEQLKQCEEENDRLNVIVQEVRDQNSHYEQLLKLQKGQLNSITLQQQWTLGKKSEQEYKQEIDQLQSELMYAKQTIQQFDYEFSKEQNNLQTIYQNLKEEHKQLKQAHIELDQQFSDILNENENLKNGINQLKGILQTKEKEIIQLMLQMKEQENANQVKLNELQNKFSVVLNETQQKNVTTINELHVSYEKQIQLKVSQAQYQLEKIQQQLESERRKNQTNQNANNSNFYKKPPKIQTIFNLKSPNSYESPQQQLSSFNQSFYQEVEKFDKQLDEVTVRSEIEQQNNCSNQQSNLSCMNQTFSANQSNVNSTQEMKKSKDISCQADHYSEDIFPPFDHRVCLRCKRNDMIAPNFCKYQKVEKISDLKDQNGSKTPKNKSLWKISKEHLYGVNIGWRQKDESYNSIKSNCTSAKNQIQEKLNSGMNTILQLVNDQPNKRKSSSLEKRKNEIINKQSISESFSYSSHSSKLYDSVS